MIVNPLIQTEDIYVRQRTDCHWSTKNRMRKSILNTKQMLCYDWFFNIHLLLSSKIHSITPTTE